MGFTRQIPTISDDLEELFARIRHGEITGITRFNNDGFFTAGRGGLFAGSYTARHFGGSFAQSYTAGQFGGSFAGSYTAGHFGGSFARSYTAGHFGGSFAHPIPPDILLDAPVDSIALHG